MTILRTAPPLAMRARFLALPFVLVAASLPVRAATTDPLRSDDCRRAIASMQVEEAAEATRRASDVVPRPALPVPVPGRSLLDARRHTAQSCLAGRADVEPVSGRSAQAPVVVEPPAPILPVASARAPSIVPPSRALPAPKRPDAVVSCDAAGCWASDGSRLQRIGPALWGPSGACTLQGTSLQCP